MKIYAIKDRLLDYYMTPFAAPSDKEVLGSIARTVNQGGSEEPIVTNPHHFEIWRLAEVTDDGHIVEARELLADASALIRQKPAGSPIGLKTA